MHRSTVVCAASEFEVTFLRTLLEQNNIEYQFIELGIGSITSAIQAGSLAKTIEGRDVLFIGSCGSTNILNVPIGAVISGLSVSWMDTEVCFNQSYKINGTEPEQILTPVENAIPSKVICAPTISLVKPDINETFNFYVENVELYGAALALLPKARSFRSLLVVTNQIGPHSHQEWKANHRKCYEDLGKFAYDFLFASQEYKLKLGDN